MITATVDMRDVAARVRKMEEKLGAPLLVTRELAKTFGIQARSVFDSQKDPYGTAWRPLKKLRTADVKAAKIRTKKGLKPRGHKILIASGDLRKSVKYELTSVNSFVLQSPMKYAAAQNYGNPKRKLPARPFLPNSRDGVPTTWLDAVSRRFTGQLLVDLQRQLMAG